MVTGGPAISVVTPAFNESANLPVLYERLAQLLERLGADWEWIVVDDHSRDTTFDVVKRLAAGDPRVHGLRLARNSGSHLAITCGLKAASGACAIVLAADLQDPPETIEPLLEKWRAGAQVVWAVRARREGIGARALLLSRLYYWILRRVVGMRDMPSTGADFFLADRRVLDALRNFKESNVSILALITWMGFRQDRIDYVKQARLHGVTGWTLAKSLKLVADSVVSFSSLPLRWISYGGVAVLLVGMLWSAVVTGRWLSGRPVGGWTLAVAAILLVGGLQTLSLGVLGEYLWRALDETRRRPRFLIEDATSALEARVASGDLIA
jgi:glycosyltransferase involved in cell wall biosynthesis